MISHLVVNGDSYMKHYVEGTGHIDLASDLLLSSAMSLAKQGSCNSRIIRTTTKHAGSNKIPTLYIVGLSFLGRIEIPVAAQSDKFEGRWLSLQNSIPRWHEYDYNWSNKNSEDLIKLKLRMEEGSVIDRFEDLAYRVMSMIEFVKSCNHKILVFSQCDSLTKDIALLPEFDFLDCPEIVQRLSWLAVAWQEQHNIPCLPEDVATIRDPFIRHRAPGHHRLLNNFLTMYIKQHKILE